MLAIIGLAAFAALTFIFAACVNLDDTRGIPYRVMVRRGGERVTVATIYGERAAYCFADQFYGSVVVPAGRD